MVEIKSKRKMTEIQEDLDTVFELAIENALGEGDEEWDGTIPESLMKDMEELELERDAKIDGVIRAIKELKGGVGTLKAEKKSLDARIKAKEAKMDGFKQYLTYVLDGAKFESAGGVVSYRNSPSVVYSAKVQEALDNNEVPEGFEDYVTKEVVVKLPKADIKEAIKAGVEFDGAENVVNRGMTIK